MESFLGLGGERKFKVSCAYGLTVLMLVFLFLPKLAAPVFADTEGTSTAVSLSADSPNTDSAIIPSVPAVSSDNPADVNAGKQKDSTEPEVQAATGQESAADPQAASDKPSNGNDDKAAKDNSSDDKSADSKNLKLSPDNLTQSNLAASAAGAVGTAGGNNVVSQSTDNNLLPDSDQSSGALAYNYPIVVPAGRNGMQPDIKLMYNSQASNENSIFGAGWYINIPYIERINRKGSEQIYSQGFFSSSMSGELLPIEGNTWGAKVDNGDYMKYTYADNYWIVKDKNGTTYTFGKTSSGRQDDPSDGTKVYKWMLQEVRDTNNNYIRYEYYKDYGQIYPIKIVYTGNGSTDGIYTIAFWTSARSDAYKSYKTGFLVTTQYRISNIIIMVNGIDIKDYSFTYDNASIANGNKSILKAISEKGFGSETYNPYTLPDTKFDYTVNASGWASNTAWNNYPVRFEESSISDVNGDGFPDIMQSYKTSAGVSTRNTYINNGDGTWTLNSNYQAPVDFFQDLGEDRLRDLGARFADINGDGLVDIIYSNPSVHQVWLNNGNGWTSSSAWQPPLSFSRGSGSDDRSYHAQLVDVNGDGLPDIISAYTINNTLKSLVYLNNGAGWSINGNWSIPVDLSNGIYISDINNDGLADMLQSYCDGTACTPVLKAYINNGHGWTEDAAWALITWVSAIAGNHDQGLRVVDYNDDGFPDIVISYIDTSGALQSRSYINNGYGWTSNDKAAYSPLQFSNYNNYSDPGSRIVDINGDGLPDLICSYKTAQSQIVSATWMNSAQGAVKIKRMTYPYGGFTDTEYKPLTQYKMGGILMNHKLPVPIEVVSKISNNDGYGNTFGGQFEYQGAKYYYNNAYDREFAGFAKITVTDNGGNKIINYYHQGDETNSSQGEYEDHISKKGKIYRTEMTDGSGSMYSKTISYWDRYDLGNGRSFVYPSQKLDMTYDGDSTHKDSAETYSYDQDTGNLSVKIEYTEVLGSDNGSWNEISWKDDYVTSYEYASKADANIYGLLSDVIVSDYLGNTVKEDKYYYDSQTLGNVIKGNQTMHERWKDGSEYVHMISKYDGTYGLVTSVIDSCGQETKFFYDSYNLYPWAVIDPGWNYTYYRYNYSSGKVKQKTDSNGRVFQYIYDSMDRLVAELQPDIANPSSLVNKTTYTYTDTSGSVSMQKTDYLDSSNVVSTYFYYDGLGREMQERQTGDSSNYIVKDYAYNNLDLLRKESIPYYSSGSARTAATTNSALYTTYTYDPMYRVKTMTDATGTISNTYNDWKMTITDRRGKNKDLYSDAFGRLVAIGEYNSGSLYTTQYNYDGLGDLIKITDAAGNVRNFTYNGLGRRTSAEDLHAPSDATFGTWYYGYADGSTNVTSKTDPNGDVVNYTYDYDNRIYTEDYAGLSGTEAQYTYDSGTDGIGRLSSITTPAYIQTFTYNPLGNISSESKKIGTVTYTTSYTYDRQGNILTITNPDGSIIKYEYGTGGVVKKVSRKESGVSSYSYVINNITYSPTGQMASVSYANGMSTVNTYDASKLYRLSSKVTTIASGVKGQSISYAYDNNGNITKLVDSSGTASLKTVNYTYDDLNRLKTAAATGVATGQLTYTESYSYNAIGNITSKTGQGNYAYAGKAGTSYANPHAVTTIGTTSLAYDKNGNLLTKGAGFTNTWDYNNRLTKTVKGTVTDIYTYDVSGERITLTSGTITTTYPTKFYNITGTAPIKHIFVNGVEVAVIIGKGTTAVAHYTSTDHLTGSNLTTNASDAREELLDYMPFGTIRIDQKSGTYTDQRKFAGHEYDSDTGLNYMDARYYDPAIGRFVSEDPVFLAIGDGNDVQKFLMDPQSLNSYAYARNNPMKYIDPTGKMFGWDDLAAAGIGGLSDLVATTVITVAVEHRLPTRSEAAGAFAGGAAAGALVENAPITGGASIGAAFTLLSYGASGVAGNVTKQTIDNIDHKQSGYDWNEAAFSGGFSMCTGGLGEKYIPNAKIPGLSSGRGNANAVGKAMKTKMANGQINNVSANTAIKAAAGSGASSVYRTAASNTADTQKNNISNAINSATSAADKALSGLRQSMSYYLRMYGYI